MGGGGTFPLLLLSLVSATDICPKETWRCGDACVSVYNLCDCGGELLAQVLGYQSLSIEQYNPEAVANKWCCMNTNLTCSRNEKFETRVKRSQATIYSEGIAATCPGTAIPLNQSCDGDCLYNGRNSHRSSLTHVAACKDTDVCVKERPNYLESYSVCNGEGQCEGELDWCRDDKRREEVFVEPFIQCSTFTLGDEGKIPGQCISATQAGDGKYDCLDRSDETSSKQQLAYPKPCVTDSVLEHLRGKPGLSCGGLNWCLHVDSWCQECNSFQCPDLGRYKFTNDKELCSNFTFWSTVPCGDGRQRCSGAWSGQCTDSWGFTEGPLVPGDCAVFGCKDNSDKFGWVFSLPESSHFHDRYSYGFAI